MLIRIGGEASEVPDGTSITDLLRTRGLPDKNIIVELNGDIVRADRWDSTRLAPGDCLEMVHLVLGG